MYSACKIMICFDTAYDQLKNWSVVNVGMSKKIATVVLNWRSFFHCPIACLVLIHGRYTRHVLQIGKR